MPGWILSMPFLSAAIGWLMAGAAAQLLFHPLQPRKILGFRFQGLVPASMTTLGRNAGKWVGDQLFSPGLLSEKITGPSAFQQIRPVMDQHIDQFLRVTLGKKMPVVSMFIGDRTIGQLKAVFMEELEQLFPVVMRQYAEGLIKELDPVKLVTEKINSIPPATIEAVIRNQAPGLFRMTRCAGAAIGFACGLLQILAWLIVR